MAKRILNHANKFGNTFKSQVSENFNNRIRVRTATLTQTTESGIFLPPGTLGTLVSNEDGQAFIDFGLLNLIGLPLNSNLIEKVEG